MVSCNRSPRFILVVHSTSTTTVAMHPRTSTVLCTIFGSFRCFRTFVRFARVKAVQGGFQGGAFVGVVKCARL